VSSPGSWATLAALGAYHGLSPGMGWLFAVALGLQEKSGRAVVRALFPIALGHAVSVGLAVGLVAAGKASIPEGVLSWLTATVLVSFGVWKLVKPRHPRWVGMRVTATGPGSCSCPCSCSARTTRCRATARAVTRRRVCR
jgi:hypothetical protein